MIQSPNPQQKRVLIVSGEASGDQHGAKLVRQVHELDPNVHFLGIGGEHMRNAGVEILVDSKNMAVVGAIEILQHFKEIYHALRTAQKTIKKDHLDLVILIDYPEFNLQVAKAAKKKGVKVLYYISPQVWAWHQSRVKTIRKRVDKMLVVFPFEEEFYRRENVPVEFVGHPLAGQVRPNLSVAAARKLFDLENRKPIIGILPGSRKGEIKRLLPTLLQSAEDLKKYYPEATFVLPLASSLTRADIEPYLKKTTVDIKITEHQFYNTVQICDAAMVTSGTATLETALLGVPMLIVYKAAASTYHIAKRIIKIPYIGLCNIVAGQKIVKELIQHEANPNTISAEIREIIDNEGYRLKMRENLAQVKSKLGAEDKAHRAAKSVLELL